MMHYYVSVIATICVFLADTIQAQINTEGMIQYFNFGSEASYPGSGNILTDLSGNNNHGLITAANGVPIFDANLGYNGALWFTDNLTVIKANLQKNTEITFMCWVTGNHKAEQFLFYADAGLYFKGGIYWNAADGTGNPFTTTIPSNYNDGNFHQYIVTQESGGTATLYYDGSLLGTARHADITKSDKLYIGGTDDIDINHSPRYSYRGAIAIWAVYNRVLDASEVQKQYANGLDATFAPTDSPTTSATDSPTTILPAKFTLPSPQCTIDVSNTASVGDVTCEFNGIVSPNDAVVSMQILGNDCVSTYNPATFGNTDVIANTPQVSGVTSYNAVANVDVTTGFSGEVEFCVRTDLKEPDFGKTMLYRSVKVKVSFSYDNSFSVAGFATTPFIGILEAETTDAVNFGVTATVCDSAGATLSSPPPLSLGTHLFICLESNANIQSISSFIAEKDGSDPFDVAASSSNVVISDLGSSNVKVVMSLPASFFADENDIELSGTVVVGYDSRRRLASSRALEDKPVENFDLFIEVEDKDNSSSAPSMMMPTVVLGVIALLFILETESIT